MLTAPIHQMYSFPLLVMKQQSNNLVTSNILPLFMILATFVLLSSQRCGVVALDLLQTEITCQSKSCMWEVLHVFSLAGL